MALILNITPWPISTLQGEVWGRERLSQSHTLGSLSRWGGESTDRRRYNSSTVTSSLTNSSGVKNHPGNQNTQHSTIWLKPRLALKHASPQNNQRTIKTKSIQRHFKDVISNVSLSLCTNDYNLRVGTCKKLINVSHFLFILIVAEILSFVNSWSWPGLYCLWIKYPRWVTIFSFLYLNVGKSFKRRQ